MSALVFAYASEHNYLDGKAQVGTPAGDRPLHHRPVRGVHPSHHRSGKVILTGYRTCGASCETDDGALDVDMTTQTLKRLPPARVEAP
ncbi:hypothetical protein GCM10009736_80220 [Actinomadura bangladeshensis]